MAGHWRLLPKLYALERNAMSHHMLAMQSIHICKSRSGPVLQSQSHSENSLLTMQWSRSLFPSSDRWIVLLGDRLSLVVNWAWNRRSSRTKPTQKLANMTCRLRSSPTLSKFLSNRKSTQAKPAALYSEQGARLQQAELSTKCEEPGSSRATKSKPTAKAVQSRSPVY